MEKVQMELVKDEKTNRFYYKNVTEKELTDEEIKASAEVDERLNKYLRIPKGLRELATYPEVAKRAVSKFVSKIKDRTKALPEQTQPTQIESDIYENQMLANLQDNVYSIGDISDNYTQLDENQKQYEREYDKFEV